MQWGMLLAVLLGLAAPVGLPAQTPPTAQEDEVIAANPGLQQKGRPVGRPSG